jgi:hypothetical protein
MSNLFNSIIQKSISKPADRKPPSINVSMERALNVTETPKITPKMTPTVVALHTSYIDQNDEFNA